MTITNTIFVITAATIFGISMAFANIHTFKNFKRDKDGFFLMVLIIADIAYLSIYLPTAIVAIASLL